MLCVVDCFGRWDETLNLASRLAKPEVVQGRTVTEKLQNKNLLTLLIKIDHLPKRQSRAKILNYKWKKEKVKICIFL